MELEESRGEFRLPPDPRVRIPEPLPVRLVAVEDVRLDVAAGLEKPLDDFYVALLEFQRLEAQDAQEGQIAYRAENFILRFDVHERPPERQAMRPLGIEVLSLPAMRKKLDEREIEYVRQRGLTPGSQSLLVLDPGGNWIEISETRQVR
jgi:hypothetical protein